LSDIPIDQRPESKHHPKGRLTPEQHRTLHEAIRSALRVHYRPTEIREYLIKSYPGSPLFALSERAFYRHLVEIREENRKYLDELAKGQFTDDWRNAKEILENCVRSLLAIRENADMKPEEKRARVDATLAIAEIEGAVINLTAQGPLVWSVQNRLREINKLAAEVKPDA
jgi:hypothetical protein